MDTVYVFLADGFEEIEAISPIDALRRAGVTVQTVGVMGKTVLGSHGIPVLADVDASTGFALPQDAVMVVLPGGGKGTENLAASKMVADVLHEAQRRDIYIAAICAAPLVLHRQGLLAGKTITAYPAVQPQLAGANVTGAAVERDGKLITARAAGVALAFSHRLIETLRGRKKADEVLMDIYPGDDKVYREGN